MPEPIVRFVGIGKTYDGITRVVDDLDLDIERGEFLTLLGPVRFGQDDDADDARRASRRRPAGEILLEGKPLSRLPPHQRNIGMVFQNYALFPHMTRRREHRLSAVGARQSAAADIAARVERALDMVQLAGLRRQAPGAALRRPAAARRGRPRAGVRAEADADGRAARARSTSSCASRCSSRSGACTSGSASRWSTSPTTRREALTMSDRIAVFHRGRIQQLDTPGADLRRPANAFVARFIGENNRLEGSTRVDRPDGRCTIRIGRRYPDRGHAGRPAAGRRRGHGFAAAGAGANRARPGIQSTHVPAASLAGTLREIVYLGDHVRARVALPAARISR